MHAANPSDWNPTSQDVLDDQIAAYDAMRNRCPVAHSDYLWWSLFRHADVKRVLEDHETFSNAASNHLSNLEDLMGIKAFSRLVKDQHLRIMNERLGQTDPLSKAFG